MNAEDQTGLYLVCATVAEADAIADAAWALYYADLIGTRVGKASGDPLSSSRWDSVEATTRYVDLITDPLVAGALVPVTVRMRDSFQGRTAALPPAARVPRDAGRAERATRARRLLGLDHEPTTRNVVCDLSGAVPRAALPQAWKDALVRMERKP